MATKKKTSKKSAAKTKSATKKSATKKSATKKTVAKKTVAKKRTKASAPRRIVPKVSPLKGTNVDDWAKKLSGWQADALCIIRALVTRHAPDATLVMKWGQPVGERNGPFAWLKPAANHVSFGFWRGAEMSDPTATSRATAIACVTSR